MEFTKLALQLALRSLAEPDPMTEHVAALEERLAMIQLTLEQSLDAQKSTAKMPRPAVSVS